MQMLRHKKGLLSHQVVIRPGAQRKIDPKYPRPRFFEPGSEQWWKKGKRPQRDSYQQRCYESEGALAKRIEQKTFANITEVAKYVRYVMEMFWFQKRFPEFEQCIVTWVPGTRIARGGPTAVSADHKEVIIGHVELSRWGMGQKDTRGGELVVLHELAHAVLPRGHGHDRRWARVFLELVGRTMGRPAKQLLAQEFKLRRVPFNPIKKQPHTERHIAALAAVRPSKDG